MYKENIFTKIINKEITNEVIYEDESVLAFKDINPVASVHILVIPKGLYVDYADFMQRSTIEEINHYFQVIANIAKKLCGDAFKLCINQGAKAGQTIFHFHTHIIGGEEFFAHINV